MKEKKIKFVNGEMYEYEIYNFVDYYSDILSNKIEPFDFNNPPIAPRYLAVSLIETMVKHRGIGLAANQVGLPYRVFVMGIDNIAFACFNPEIIDTQGEESIQEGCLSYPGLYLPIKRHYKINVRYIEMNGNLKETTFEGLTARIFQHELDHLNGIRYTTLVNSIKLDSAKRKVKKNLKQLQNVVNY
jgi:peptide deformylase